MLSKSKKMLQVSINVNSFDKLNTFCKSNGISKSVVIDMLIRTKLEKLLK